MNKKMCRTLSASVPAVLLVISLASEAQSPVPAAPAAAPPPIPFAAANLTPAGARALAANCAACHGTNGNSAGGAIPGLAGGNKDYFVAQMKAFKEGKREATVMHQIAKGYSEAEIAAKPIILADVSERQSQGRGLFVLGLACLVVGLVSAAVIARNMMRAWRMAKA